MMTSSHNASEKMMALRESAALFARCFYIAESIQAPYTSMN